MLNWLAENIGTIIISAALIAVVAAVIIGMLRDRKKGKSACGCGCSHCAMSGSCHSQKQP